MEVLIDPVIFKLGFFELRWYSLAYIVGFIVAGMLGIYVNKFALPANILTKQKLDYLLNYYILSVILGGRLGYVIFYKPLYYFANPHKIFYLWEGGMSFHGGVCGIIIAGILFAKTQKYNLWHLFDRTAFCVLPGLFLGRIANFINGELWGKPTASAIGFIFPASGSLTPRHPSQLYEALFEGLVPFIILCFVLKFTKLFHREGVFSAFFLIFYGTARFIIEAFFREGEGFVNFGLFILSTGQILCTLMIALGFIVLAIKFIKPLPLSFPSKKGGIPE